MKASEFYEKYWKLSNGKGEMISPPKLNDEEKDFLDNCAEQQNCQGAIFIRKRRRTVQINIEVLKEQMKKFPPYFIPAHPPLLDKYGSPKNENSPDQE